VLPKLRTLHAPTDAWADYDVQDARSLGDQIEEGGLSEGTKPWRPGQRALSQP